MNGTEGTKKTKNQILMVLGFFEPPPMGGMVLANNHEFQENSYPVPAWGVGLVVMCIRFSVVFIGRACVAGLVGVLHEVPGAI